jgi:hypothetical protein
MKQITPYQAYKNEINRLLAKAQNGGGWEVNFTCKEPLEETSLARCTYNMVGRWVRVSFNAKTCKTVAAARRAAKHEFGHFVTARIDKLAMDRHSSEIEISEELEAISRVFERLA